ncbi:hypothetical protein [Glycomyces albidus]|uniref:Uncharacterized protein n=1 Tax=Glycomyces albidus TaxID=2656774 RepID=A0A6L5G985_9ACTN|nr:hypothetical protein [Glycomyces albidus]MQM26215.1 hypothetical protein [Glycomyces albidus]
MPDELVIELSPGEGVSAARFDRLCSEVADEVRSVRGLAVASPQVEPAPGSKAGLGQEIGVLIVSGLVSAAGLKAIADVVIACVQRTTIGSVTVRRGETEVTMTGLHPKDVPGETAKLVKALEEAQ